METFCNFAKCTPVKLLIQALGRAFPIEEGSVTKFTLFNFVVLCLILFLRLLNVDIHVPFELHTDWPGFKFWTVLLCLVPLNVTVQLSMIKDMCLFIRLNSSLLRILILQPAQAGDLDTMVFLLCIKIHGLGIPHPQYYQSFYLIDCLADCIKSGCKESH